MSSGCSTGRSLASAAAAVTADPIYGAIDESTGPGAAPRAVREDRFARLRLMRTPTVGPVTHTQLLARFGTAAAALEAIPDMARKGGGKPPVVPSRAAVEKEVPAVEAVGARYLFLGLPG